MITFPANPTAGQAYQAANGVTYTYNGTGWDTVTSSSGSGGGSFSSDNWAVKQDGQNLDFLYNGAIEFTMYPNGDARAAGNFITTANYLRDVPIATQTISMGQSNGLTGYAIGGYIVGKYGSTQFTYSGDSVVPAGDYTVTNATPTATYYFNYSTASRAQTVQILARFITGSWSVNAIHMLYDSNHNLLATVTTNTLGWGTITPLTATLTLNPGERLGFYVMCTSQWQGDYEKNTAVELLVDLTLSFVGWA